MKKWFVTVLAGCVVAGLVFGLAAPQAQAIKQFKDEFDAKYVKPDSQDAKEKGLAEAASAAKCLICHEGESKKQRNAYGQALDQLLDKKEDKENKEKIQAALDSVAKQKVDPNDAASPTFGDLLKAGKLPGGEPKSAE